MRILRFLRIAAIIYRAHKLGVIDVRSFYLYGVFARYKDVLVEEVSDRVVVHVLSGIQSEVSGSSGVVDRIWLEAIAPHKDEITHSVELAAERFLQQAISARKPALDAYVERVLSEALQSSRHVFDSLKAMPFWGQIVVDQIETAIKTIVGNVVDNLLEDSKGIAFRRLAAEAERTIAVALADRDTGIEDIVRQVIDQSLEIVKDQVKVQQWKLREEADGG